MDQLPDSLPQIVPAPILPPPASFPKLPIKLLVAVVVSVAVLILVVVLRMIGRGWRRAGDIKIVPTPTVVEQEANDADANVTREVPRLALTTLAGHQLVIVWGLILILRW